MTTKAGKAPAVQPTEHPYIVRVAGVCGGSPIVTGTRIAVRHLAQLYKRGETVDEILAAHPHLSAAAVHDAISYYLDHQAEIEQEILQGRLQWLGEKHDFSVDERGFVRFGKGQGAS